MKLRFTKMHGLGNDFVVIDAVRQAVDLGPQQVRFLADRHRGIGCDQLLLVEPPRIAEADFRYRIFNADGGEVEQCGNGARCFARFVVEQGLTDRREITVETAAGLIHPRLEADGQVTVEMGVPRLAPAEIPFQAEAQALRYPLSLEDGEVEIGAVSMGNPHAVIEVEDVATAAVAEWGPQVSGHPRFPQRCNVGFMQVVSPQQLRLRVYERGAGETQACGTGACAAAVVARLWGRCEERVAVDLPGGRLYIRWAGEGSPVYMTGPATTVFEGSIEV